MGTLTIKFTLRPKILYQNVNVRIFARHHRIGRPSSEPPRYFTFRNPVDCRRLCCIFKRRSFKMQLSTGPQNQAPTTTKQNVKIQSKLTINFLRSAEHFRHRRRFLLVNLVFLFNLIRI